MSEIFLTGGSGFLGSRVIPALLRRGDRVRCLVRGEREPIDGLTWVRGDLLDPASWTPQLAGVDAVLHLAAATGKAGAVEHRRVNAEGTRRLLDGCGKSGVSRFLFVSTIAAKFPDLERYYYAQAKLAAEPAVRESGLRFTILRPTIIVGPGSPIVEALSKLAGLPVMPVFGDGSTEVQPIWVEDAARRIVELLERDRFAGETFEIGGPDRVSIEALMLAIRIARGKTPGAVLHLPLGVLLPLLGAAERLLYRFMPVTVGQLATYRFDGTVAGNPLHDESADSLRGVTSMLERSLER